jgi:hypothetical protein
MQSPAKTASSKWTSRRDNDGFGITTYPDHHGTEGLLAAPRQKEPMMNTEASTTLFAGLDLHANDVGLVHALGSLG